MIRRAAVLLAAVLACAACGPGDSGAPGTESGPAGVEAELDGIESTLDQIEAELEGG
ncbi:hypothetical protein ACFPM7_02080 [Actinokineospora guangxiensis]|uniref:Uncharacterized protein n=1 Tax=Actinokineospora guangxiensis TaxID=1490288 RepID=A0ABW0EEI8_9PSEU